jgi:5-deoxy-D-glucuronate isomerase
VKRYFPAKDGNQSITPEVANWQYCGLSIFSHFVGAFEIPLELTESNEAALIPLKGRDINRWRGVSSKWT